MWSDEIFGSEVSYFSGIDPSTVELIKKIEKEISWLNWEFTHHYDTFHRRNFEKACGYRKQDGDLPPYLSFGIAFDFESEEKKTYSALLSNYQFERQYQVERWLNEMGYSIICDGESFLGPTVSNLYLDFTNYTIITTPCFTITSKGLGDGKFKIDLELKDPPTPKWMSARIGVMDYEFDLGQFYPIFGDKDNGTKVIAEMNRLLEEYSRVAQKHHQSFTDSHSFQTKYGEEDMKLILVELDDNSDNPIRSEMTLNYLQDKKQFEADLHRYVEEGIRAEGYSITFDGEEKNGIKSPSLVLSELDGFNSSTKNAALITPHYTMTVTHFEKGKLLIFITTN